MLQCKARHLKEFCITGGTLTTELGQNQIRKYLNLPNFLH